MRIYVLIAAIFLFAVAERATADTQLEGCVARRPITLGTRVAADLKTTYELEDKLRVCVVKATYPYSTGRGHRLSSCFAVAVGNDSKEFCGDGETHVDFHGYRIHVGLRTPRFTSSCDVWLRIEPAPTPRAT